ncbi:hypothetical protein [Kitasatospora sp. HPMI-4]|uniref:hypothetical protein n=1 Tax=Kitasatospora sp. HPMI-4 TaxID=3448443 RepID=UPI003F1D97CE
MVGAETTAGKTGLPEVVRDVVAEVAPEELPLVAALAALDEAAALRRLARPSTRQDPLGFGLGEVAALVTPVVWLAVNEAARQLGGEAASGAAKGAKAVARRLLHRREETVIPALTREQLVQVRQLVLETAAQRGLGEQRASAIADAVVARLALTAPDQEPAAGPPDPTGPAGEGTAARG